MEPRRPLLWVALTLVSLGCRDVLGIGETPPEPSSSTVASSASSGGTSSTGSSGSGGGSSTSSAGGGGSSSSAAGGGQGGGLPQPGPIEWVVGLGSPGNDSIVSAAVAADGRSAIAIQFQGLLTLPPPRGLAIDSVDQIGLALVVLEADGSVAWAQHVASAELADDIYHLALAFEDDGTLLVVGTIPGSTGLVIGGEPLAAVTYADVFAVRLDQDGNAGPPSQWGDGGTQLASAMHRREDGHVFVAGGYCGNLGFGCVEERVVPCGDEGRFDPYVAELNPDLTCKNLVSWEGIGHVRSVHANAEGEVLLSGAFAGTLSLGGLAAELEVDTGVEGDVWTFVARLDASRDGTYAGVVAETDLPFRGFLDERGEAYVAGTLGQSPHFQLGPDRPDGASDLFLARLSASGTEGAPQPIWNRFVGGSSTDGAVNLRPGPAAARAYGYFNGQVAIDGMGLESQLQDGLVLDVNADGDAVDAQAIGAENFELLADGGFDQRGAEVMFGQFGSSGAELDLGGLSRPVLNQGLDDVFVARRGAPP